MKFTLQHTDPQSGARAGLINTDHGTVETPIFMPVGTAATVKGIFHRDLREDVKAQIILANTYHLYLRPGMKILEEAGGVHRFSTWDRPMLTDSGGFQVFSLAACRKLKEEGCHFQSHIDGSRHLFTPESVIDTERTIGADIMMAFDECPPGDAPKEYAAKSLALTERWLDRCFNQSHKTQPKYGHYQSLFPIVQGCGYPDLRARYSYPDFPLFLTHDEQYCGVLPLTADAYRSLLAHFRAAEQFIRAHGTDPMWSCHARSQLISVMCLAESAYQGKQTGGEDAIVRYIREHAERPMSVESLCRMFNTNRTTLTKTIKAATGLPPMQFVLEERLNQSRPDLLFTSLPIGFIAMKYGFSDANYYIRAFKQRFGQSPLQYRNEQIEKWHANKE